MFISKKDLSVRMRGKYVNTFNKPKNKAESLFTVVFSSLCSSFFQGTWWMYGSFKIHSLSVAILQWTAVTSTVCFPVNGTYKLTAKFYTQQ